MVIERHVITFALAPMTYMLPYNTTEAKIFSDVCCPQLAPFPAFNLVFETDFLQAAHHKERSEM